MSTSWAVLSPYHSATDCPAWWKMSMRTIIQDVLISHAETVVASSICSMTFRFYKIRTSDSRAFVVSFFVFRSLVFTTLSCASHQPLLSQMVQVGKPVEARQPKPTPSKHSQKASDNAKDGPTFLLSSSLTLLARRGMHGKRHLASSLPTSSPDM